MIKSLTAVFLVVLMVLEMIPCKPVFAQMQQGAYFLEELKKVMSEGAEEEKGKIEAQRSHRSAFNKALPLSVCAAIRTMRPFSAA